MYTTSHSVQRGATLIIVLMALLVITVIGVLSVKQSTTDLSITTSTQVNKLLFQTADMGLAKLEAEARSGNATLPTGSLGFMNSEVASDGRVGREVVFCLRPRNKAFFDPRYVTEKDKLGTGTVGGRQSGYCNPTSANDYISQRGATMTQLRILKDPPLKCTDAFCKKPKLSSFPNGNNLEKKLLNIQSYNVASTAVMPSFSFSQTSSSQKNTDIAACMKKMVEGSDTISTCLTGYGVPHSTHTQQYDYRLEKVDRL